jgi:small GTP-binding protein
MGASQSNHGQNVLLLGLEGSGKTSIVARLLRDDPRTVLPTLGNAMRAFSLDGGRHVMKMWDVGGSSSMRSYWPAYYSKAHAIAFVIDSTDRRRLAETSAVLQQVLDADKLLGLPLLLLASKQDAPGAIPTSELEVLLKLGSIRDRSWRCIECSALTGQGIEAGLRWLTGEFAPRGAKGASASKLGSTTSASPRGGGLARGGSRTWRSRAEPRSSGTPGDSGRSRRGAAAAARRGQDEEAHDDEDDEGDDEEEEPKRRSSARRLGFGPSSSPARGGRSVKERDVSESSTAVSDADGAANNNKGGAGGGSSKTTTRAQRQAERRKAAEVERKASSDADSDASGRSD